MSEVSIHLSSVSKKYHQYFLYKNLNIDIFPKEKLAITGNNGSGKTTLLKIMAGFVSPSSGKVVLKLNKKEIEITKWHQYISIAAPYMNLIEEFTVAELLQHVSIYRNFQKDINALSELLQLNNHLNKPFKQFSSGMKQRVRLLIAVTDAAPVLFLDEPCANLDASSVKWYETMIEQFAINKTVIVFSNSQAQEYFFCNRHFSLSQ